MMLHRGVIVLVFAIVGLAVSGRAPAEPIIVDLPAQPLARSLTEYARQAGLLLTIDNALIAGKQAPAVRGSLEPVQVLDRLLDGSGLQARQLGIGNFTVEPVPPPPPPGDAEALQDVTVVGKQPVEVGPMRGIALDPKQIPGNLQRATAEDIADSHAISLGDYMNSRMQSVTVNDYQGNPYQMDVVYRGFTAGPQLGTPQGLSMFFDGVRMNEPFGDVVNWDLVPLNAIESFEVYPGSNPLFGLNTLGGALAVRTKSGFTQQGTQLTVTGGSWERKHGQLSVGGNNGVVGGFFALTGFDEAGWRDNSPSTVKQGFGRLDFEGERTSLTASMLLAGTDLIGNGLIPDALYQEDHSAIFSSPDQTENTLRQFTLNGLYDLDGDFNVTGSLYLRTSDRETVTGDIYEDFQDFGNADNTGRTISTGVQPCQMVDVNQDFFPDYNLDYDGDGIAEPGTYNADPNIPDAFGNFGNYVFLDPLNGPNCGSRWVFDATNIKARNGRSFFPEFSPHSSGVVEGTPVSVINRSTIEQRGHGGSLQLNWDGDPHKLTVGMSLDHTDASYVSAQRLGLLGPGRVAYLAPDEIDSRYYAAQFDIPQNDFAGSTETKSLYFSENWSPRDDLHLNVSARYNVTDNHNVLNTRTRSGFSNLHDYKIRRDVTPQVFCPTTDPASCPAPPPDLIYPSAEMFETTPTDEKISYYSINPSVGVSWEATPGLNFFGNFSRGARAPSSIELGCAFDATPVTDETQPGQVVPRSLSGFATPCNLPTALSGDPYLPQIRSNSVEIGVRGRLGPNWEWNSSLYRTDLQDDLYLVGITGTSTFFDSIGDTRRQGLEAGISGRIGRAKLSLNYALTDATFQSRFWLYSPYNSSSDLDMNHMLSDLQYPGQQPLSLNNRGFGTYQQIRVDPGARMPGSSLHNLNASLDYALTDKWTIGLTAIAHSMMYIRGNENNEHVEGATNTITQMDEFTRDCLAFDPITAECVQFTPFRLVARGAETETAPYRGKGTIPGYVVFNLQSTLRLGEGLTITGRVNNLFDNEYASAGRLGINPFTPSTVGAIGPSGFNYNSIEWQAARFIGPGGPRAFWLTVDYRF